MRMEDHFRDTLLSRGVCASCLYSLAGLEAGGDGCLVCPECAGAWKRSRVREFIAFDEHAVVSPVASQRAC